MPLKAKINHHTQKQKKLYGKSYEVGNDNTDWHYQSRKIDLTKNAGIIPKNRGGLIKTIRKIVPRYVTGKIKQGSRNIFCRYFC